MYFFVSLRYVSFRSFFLYCLNSLTLLPLFNNRSVLSDYSKSILILYCNQVSSLFSASVFSYISFNLSSWFMSPISSTILMAILCIFSSFFTCYFLWGDPMTPAYFSFGLITVVIFFIISWSEMHFLYSLAYCMYLQLYFLYASLVTNHPEWPFPGLFPLFLISYYFLFCKCM